jgi:hypothetical protein
LFPLQRTRTQLSWIRALTETSEGRVHGEHSRLYTASQAVIASQASLKAHQSHHPKCDLTVINFFLGLGRGPLSLVRINEELLERKVAAPV